jgi:hypothetical protein
VLGSRKHNKLDTRDDSTQKTKKPSQWDVIKEIK